MINLLQFHEWLIERMDLNAESFSSSNEIENEVYRICVEWIAEGNKEEGESYWNNLCDEYNDYKISYEKNNTIAEDVEEHTREMKTVEKVIAEVKEEIKNIYSALTNTKKILNKHYQIFVKELENNTVEVYLHLAIKFQYENNLTNYAKNERFIRVTIAENLKLKEACLLARKFKKEFEELTACKTNLRYLKFEEIDWF